jgi:hypothetical protein
MSQYKVLLCVLIVLLASISTTLLMKHRVDSIVETPAPESAAPVDPESLPPTGPGSAVAQDVPAVVCTRCSGFALRRNGEALAYFTTGQHLPQKSLENAPADQIAHVDNARRISGAQEPTPGIAIYNTDLREIMEKIAAENATPDFLEPSYEAFCMEVVRRYVEMHRWR